MPTSLQRFQVTETPDVAAAIDTAAILWPDESRSRLLAKLIDAGGRALQNEVNGGTEARLRAIRSVVGTLDEIYQPGYLDELRNDWPD
jgi:hypothetical protein